MARTDKSSNNTNSKSKDTKKTTSTKSEKTLEKKRSSPDDDDHSSTESQDDDHDEEGEVDQMEYHKLLCKLFPSQHMKKKVDAGNKLKKALKIDVDGDEEDDDDEGQGENSSGDYEPIKTTKKNKIVTDTKKTASKSKRKAKNNEESDADEEAEVEVEEAEDPRKKSKKERRVPKAKSGGSSGDYNIIFTIGGEEYDEDEDEDYEWDDDDSDESEYSSEDEDVSVSSVSDSSEEEEEEDDEDEDDEDDEQEEEEEEEEWIPEPKKRSRAHRAGAITRSKTTAENKESTSDSKEKSKDTTESSSSTSQADANAVLTTMRKLCAENPKNKLLQESLNIGIDHYKSKIEKSERQKERKEQKQKDKNARIFKKLLRNKEKTNDYTFFDGLERDKQVKLIKEIREVNKISNVETPYRISLLESKIPHVFKSIALKKLDSLKYMEPGSGEFYKIKNWVDTFMRIPFDTIRTLPVNINDGVDKCHEFMENAQKTLDDAVYGLDDAKMQIMQMLGQLITNPQAIGSAIAIKGPMGTGKTTLVKEGISKILDRPFAFLALGGATDSSFLEGHSYTYEGSVWGKIVQILLDSKCMNPVIYFDELDKISDTPKGEEIAGILTHLTDTSQNSQFHDKYFSEVDFDLSKCLFIFSYNDESKVNPILRDRMYRIQTKGYDVKQKMVISNKHIIPKIRQQVIFKEEDIIIPDDTIRHIVDSFCDKEDGVRNLKRCLEIVYTKLNLYRLMKPGTNLFQKEMSLEVSFPFTVTKEVVDKLIKREEKSWSAQTMYI